MSGKENEAPELEYFYRTMNRVSALNYCVVCLRNDTERNLAVSRYLKKFATAVNIDNEWQNHQTCFMCERQAANALKFFKAAVFASSVNKIFEDLTYYRRKGYVKDQFLKALKKISVGTDMKSPSDWEAQLMLIRRRTQMSETEPLVIDNQGVKSKPILNPNEVILIPDNYMGQVTATVTRSFGITDFPDLAGRPAGRTRQPDRHGTKNGRTSSIVMSTEDSFMLSSSQPQVSETFVILEDDEEQDPLQLKIENVKSESENYQRPQTPDLPTLQAKPYDPINGPQPALKIVPDSGDCQSIVNIDSDITGPQSLNMVPMEKLLEPPKTSDNSLVLNNCTDSNFIIHPIILNGGILTVPSLAATIVDGVLTIQTPAAPRENNMLKELIQNPIKEIPLPTTNEFSQTDFPRRYPKCGVPLNTEANLAKNKRDNEFMFATPCKKVKGLPVIESVTSEAVRSDRIDWEDKIPMDVISFVDALDPNPPQFIEPNTTPNLEASGVGPHVQCTQTPVDPNVIDLC